MLLQDRHRTLHVSFRVHIQEGIQRVMYFLSLFHFQLRLQMFPEEQ